jgi:hypothetical protein
MDGDVQLDCSVPTPWNSHWGWPLIFKGRTRWRKKVGSSSALSVLGPFVPRSHQAIGAKAVVPIGLASSTMILACQDVAGHEKKSVATATHCWGCRATYAPNLGQRHSSGQGSGSASPI